MALRNILTIGEEVLRKKSKEVKEVNDKIKQIIDDMTETMYENNGVGLAAPQIGLLKQIIVLDDGEGLIELINPKIVNKSGIQIEVEGCLSIPNVFGEVERPLKVTVEGLNRDGEKVTVKGKNFLTRILCHEIDHLNGILFEDKVIRFINDENMEK